MNAYVCVTYAQEDREINDGFCRALARYGFRYACVNELSDPVKGRGVLTEAALLIALTSPAAERAETVAADIRRALERGMKVLCVSLAESELDDRFCTGSTEGAVRIPYPVGETPDRHSVSLFVHRLFVRHLACHTECFVESRCAEDVYGGIIRMACRAHSGDGNACYALGRAYELGDGVPALENEAARWISAAAEQGLSDALIRMGILRQTGKGIERDPRAAYTLFDRARRQGDPRGEYRVGLCYLEGCGVIMDPEQGAAYLTGAARTGYAPALYRLACLCRDGIGVTRDVRRARDLLYAACMADRDENSPLPRLSLYGRRGRCGCVSLRYLRQTALSRLLGEAALRPPKDKRKDPRASVNRCLGMTEYRTVELPEDRGGWMKGGCDSSARPSDGLNDFVAADAAFALGALLEAGDPATGFRPSPTAALKWYRYAIRLGHAEAIFALGDAYRRGVGVPALEKRAVALFRMAADRGSLRGQFAFGVCCEQGIGMDEDPAMAVRYYELAARAGYAPARHNLGGCYEQGRGVLRDELTAVEWYSKAAESGLTESMCRLAFCYEQGRGVSADPATALRFFEEAADGGHAYAQYRLGLYYHKRAEERDRKAKEAMAAVDASRLSGKGEISEGTVLEESRKGDEETLFGISDRLRALSFYRQAADNGSAEAAYALFICYRLGLGVAPDEAMEVECLRRAAEGGCLQAVYELGLCHMEGRGMPRNQQAAVACFTRVRTAWREALLTEGRREEAGAVPPGGITACHAAGSALYMLGYCRLYGIGETDRNRIPDPAKRPSPERVTEAAALLRASAQLDHSGALILLGDLHLYGLMPPAGSASPEDEALDFYLKAARDGQKWRERRVATADRTDHPLDAYMTLAKLALRRAEQAEDEGDAALSRGNAWHSFSDSANLGSADALVGLAECLYRGWGEARNLTYAKRLLYRASVLNHGRVGASLWLGDLLRTAPDGEPDPAGADAAYLQGLETPSVESECGPYTLGLRRAERRQADEAARTEVYYRLATLRAVYFADGPRRRESFPYLAEAILRGHETALEDLARIYAYETAHPRALREEEGTKKCLTLSRMTGQGRALSRLSKGDDPTRSERAAQMHHSWMSDYYVALCPEPVPFTREMHPVAVLGDVPGYVTAAVTPQMKVDALCYLGECFFEGRGLPTRPEAAVECYRAAVKVPLRLQRNQPMPVSLMNAIYSLGWCLLYGVGTAVNADKAVKLLTRVAKVHSGAAYTLGICHEEGRGVMIPDPREALKHYRKAQSMGHPKAAERIPRLEKLLRNQEDSD